MVYDINVENHSNPLQSNIRFLVLPCTYTWTSFQRSFIYTCVDLTECYEIEYLMQQKNSQIAH